MLEKMFLIKSRGSTVSREIVGGLVTFMTMAYIITAHPFIVNAKSPDWGSPLDEVNLSLIVAVCLISGLATLLMALVANYPVALAPGMGINLLFATMIGSTAMHGMGIDPAAALGVIFVAGLLFLLLTFLRVREILMKLVSPSQQSAIVLGIGLFILMLGIMNCFKYPGDYDLLGWRFSFVWDSTIFLVFVINLVIVAALYVLRVPGALFFGMLAGVVVSMLFGILHFDSVVGVPERFVAPTFMKIDIMAALSIQLLPFIAIFLYIDIFDTLGTLIGVSRRAGFLKSDGSLPQARQAMMADAVGTVTGSVFGLSPVTSFIESSAGISSGARTGLASVVTALLFFASILFTPFWSGLSVGYIVGPVLIIVGFFMMTEVKHINWRDWTDAVPAILTMVAMLAFRTINDGLAAGFITYPLCKFIGGKLSQLNWLHWLMAVISIAMVIIIRTSF